MSGVASDNFDRNSASQGLAGGAGYPGGNIHGGGGHYSGGAGVSFQSPSAAELLAAQTRIDNLRAVALSQAVGAQAAKQDVNSSALDACNIIESARQFYAFLSGDTPISEG